MSVFFLILAIFAWGVIHSLTASLGAKEWARRRLGSGSMIYYRLAYNIFSLISFIPILWLMVVLPDRVLYRIPAPWTFLTLAGQLLAVGILIIGVLQTGALSFVGFRQLLEGKERPSQLVTSGLYRWVRHPLYAAGLLFIWLTPVVSRNTLVVMVAATVYIILGALFEERKLEREFGQAYAEYKASTPMLIPGLKFGRNKSRS